MSLSRSLHLQTTTHAAPATDTPPSLQPPLAVLRSLADRNELLSRPSNPHKTSPSPRIRLLCFASRVAVLQSTRVPQKSPGWISTPESRESSLQQIAVLTARCSSVCAVHHRRCAGIGFVTALSVCLSITITNTPADAPTESRSASFRRPTKTTSRPKRSRLRSK
jgi:hypothetical protein